MVFAWYFFCIKSNKRSSMSPQNRCTAESIQKMKTRFRGLIHESINCYFSEAMSNFKNLSYVMNESGYKVKLNFSQMEYKTFYIDNGVERESRKPISFLKSERETDKMVNLDFSDRRRIVRMVDNLYNSLRTIAELGSEKKLDELLSLLSDACATREKNLRELGEDDSICYEKPSKLFAKVPGIYDVPNYPGNVFFISADPIDIFMKSTNQGWQEDSCERYGGEFEQGSFSDIENCSFVCFLTKKGRRTVQQSIARIMLRLCYVTMKSKKHGYTWAHEADWYTITGKTSILRTERGIPIYDPFRIDRFADRGISGKELTDSLVDVLSSIGLITEYTKCVTPFKYCGYSDIERTGDTAITYSRRVRKCRHCKNPVTSLYAKKHEGYCRPCYIDYEHNPDEYIEDDPYEE